MKKRLFFALPFLFACVFACLPVALRASGEEELAHTFFMQGKFEEALTLWYEQAEAGDHTKGLYYNIGLAESQLKHTAEAMLAFEQAHRLAPGDQVILTAIAEERKRIENATIPVDAFFLTTWYKGLVMFFRPGLWALLGLGFLGVGVFLGFRKTNLLLFAFQVHKRIGVYMAISGLLFVLLAFLSYAELSQDDEAIVFEHCGMHQAPAEDSPQVRTLSPGEKIVLIDSIGEWYNVRLLNLDQGWIKGKSLKTIRIGSM